MSIYALTDLHGRFDIWKKLDKYFFKPDDIIYFLGDAADRGRDGWKLIKTLLDDKRVIYIKGNHEDMLINAIEDYEEYGVMESYPIRLLFSNGGEKTFRDYLLDKRINQVETFLKLKDLPEIKRYINPRGDIFDLCHAGFSYNQKDIDFIWDREHLNDSWIEGFDKHTIVHGHTPVQTLDENGEIKIENICYCDKHKVNLDLGVVWSDNIALLNLDNNELIIYP